MAKTLVEELRSIDDAVNSITRFVRRDVKYNYEMSYKKLLDEWREKHPLVDKAIREEVDISVIVGELAQRYDGWRAYLPRLKDKNHDRMIEELKLNELFYANGLKTEIFPSGGAAEKHPYLSRTISLFFEKCVNPPVMALLGGMTYIAISGDMTVDYASFGLGASLFGAMGFFLSFAIKKLFIDFPKSDAKYLQGKINDYRARYISVS